MNLVDGSVEICYDPAAAYRHMVTDLGQGFCDQVIGSQLDSIYPMIVVLGEQVTDFFVGESETDRGFDFAGNFFDQV